MGDGRDVAVVTASRYPHGYASVRSLAREGVDTVAAVDDPTLPITASRYCDETAEVPPPSEFLEYKDALLEIARRPAVRTIVPHRPQDPYLFAKYADEFDPIVDLVVPSLETLRLAHDRNELMAAAEAAGVPVPETDLLGDADSRDVDRIVKSRYNLVTSEYVDSFDPEEGEIEKSIIHVPADDSLDVDAIRGQMNHEPIVQEYVDATDQYVFGALYDHGEALATFQHRQLRADSYTGGGGVYRETIHEPELEAVGRELLDHLEWHGLACIEYVEDANTGEFKLIELNPRMWQSLPCATRAGAAFPYWYWLQATGRADEIDPGFEVDVKTHYLFGEIEHLASVVSEESPVVDPPSLPVRTAEILASCVATPGFDYLHLDDPSPALRHARRELGGALGRRIN